LAEAYSDGQVITQAAPELTPLFKDLAEKLRQLSRASSPAKEATSHA